MIVSTRGRESTSVGLVLARFAVGPRTGDGEYYLAGLFSRSVLKMFVLTARDERVRHGEYGHSRESWRHSRRRPPGIELLPT